MAKAKTPPKPYYIHHRSALDSIVSDYHESYANGELFSGPSILSIFNALESGITRHRLRNYQLKALFILDSLYAQALSEENLARQVGKYRKNPLVSDLMEVIDKEEQYKAPFMGFEMATGSGKTMLMGASVYLLYQKYNVRNFLIITPSSLDIYKKTIRNFTIGGIDSIWADDTSFHFNLVTGDNYTERLFVEPYSQVNIFIFNIDKFGSNAVNTEKCWESSIWQDRTGNTISIKEFLKTEDLVIITDEAHHTQGQKSHNIIKRFHPRAVLEYTATALEDSSKEEKRSQQIVYKYNIRNFLEDGYGKIVRAVALAAPVDQRKKQKEIADTERFKLITLLLIHLIKKQAVIKDPKSRPVKPVAFIKVKQDTNYTRKVFDYLQQELPHDIGNIDIVLQKAATQDLEITGLITGYLQKELHNNKKKLYKELQEVCRNAIFYHGKSDQETNRKFAEIRKNKIELVVYMEKLDEGIDLPNIYTMAVINDTISSFKTSVKQIIGRGVRLPKEKREFDEEKSDILLTQCEKLHVVCDQGKNFEEVILSIQKEFGLTDKYLCTDRPRVLITNKAKSDRLDKRYIPHIRADFKIKPGIKLMDLVTDTDTIINHFLDDNCFTGPDETDTEKKYLKYKPESFFTEVDVFSDKEIYHEQLRNFGADFVKLELDAKHSSAIYGIVQKTLFCLPDTKKVHTVFNEYVNRLNTIGLLYPKLDAADIPLAANQFVHNFAFFYRNYIEKHYYKLDFLQTGSSDSWSLQQRFTDYQVKIPEDQVKNKKWKKITDENKIIEYIKTQFHFYGYENTIFDYVKFDTLVEKQFADFAEKCIEEYIIADTDSDKPFWVKNDRQIFFTYGSHKYYPDFIMLHKGIFYIVETKGEIYSDSRKNLLLAQLNQHKGYEGVLVFSDVLQEKDIQDLSFDDFLECAQAAVLMHQSKANLEAQPKESDKFVCYIPVYQHRQIYKKLHKEKSSKPLGWLPVPKKQSPYPDTAFAVQVKGKMLLPEYKHNDWIIMNSKFDLKECPGQVVLITHEAIDDGYDEHMTIRRLQVEHKTIQEGLFETAINTLVLQSLSGSNEIRIDGVQVKDVLIMGVKIV